MSQEFSLYPISYFLGNCTNIQADEKGEFNCHQKYILDINNNRIKTCHNSRDFMRKITGCKNSGLNKVTEYIFKEAESNSGFITRYLKSKTLEQKIAFQPNLLRLFFNGWQ